MNRRAPHTSISLESGFMSCAGESGEPESAGEPEGPVVGLTVHGQPSTGQAQQVGEIDFEEFDAEHLISGARVANPASRNILEKCGFQWSGVELHRFEALGSSTPVDRFRLTPR